MAIKILSDEEKRDAFRAMNDPSRVIYHIAHARKENCALKYEDRDVVGEYDAVVDEHIEAAAEVFQIFDERKIKQHS